MVHGVASAWGVGTTSSDAVGTVPASRWDAPVEQRVSYGAFMHGIQLFDHRTFGLAPAEAELMDPHQRLALEGGYSALHGAGLERAALMGSVTGVFAGIWQSDYSSVLPTRGAASRGPFAVAASGCAMLVGRLSYTLGLQGPSIPYDTACSSSLSASHAALSALQCRETGPALVLGVNIMCASGVSQLFAVAQMTSPTGWSYAFDSRADGYARGEGVGGLVLGGASLGVVQSRALVRGSSVQHDGESASLTAPNGSAQAAIALQNARLHYQASTDPLTGLANRGFMKQVFEDELQQARGFVHPARRELHWECPVCLEEFSAFADPLQCPCAGRHKFCRPCLLRYEGRV